MIISILIYISSTLVTLYSVYLGTIFIVGMFVKDKGYFVAKQETMAILILCNNEERVILRLINALKNQTYDKDKYDIYVIAHNCIDSIASIASNNGVQVIEYNNPLKRTKADALDFGLKYVDKEKEMSISILLCSMQIVYLHQIF